MRTIEEISNISPIANGQSFTLTLPVGRTYERLTLRLGGTFVVANITNLQLRINGKVVQEYATGAILDAINKFYGIGDTAGLLSFNFTRPWMKRAADDAFVTGLGTTDVQTVQVTGDISGATAPTLTAYAVLSAPQPLGLMTKVRRLSVNAAAAGSIAIDNIPRGPRIMAMHIGKSDCTAVDLQAESRRIITASKTDLHEVFARHGRVAQTGYTHVDMMFTDRIDDALVTVVGNGPGNSGRPIDLRAMLTLGTSGAFDIYTEYLDGWSGL